MQVQKVIDLAATKCGSQNALAKTLGMPSGTVSAWRNLKQACPPKHVVRMAEIAGLEPNATARAVYMEWKERQITAKLGKLTKAVALGGVAMLTIFGASERAQAAADRGEKCATMYRNVNLRRLWLRLHLSARLAARVIAAT